MRKGQANAGFTLIELLIVIAIIGILAAVLIPNLLAARNKANRTAAQAYGKECITAVETARNSATGALPTATACSDTALTGKPLPAAVTAATVTYTGSDAYNVSVDVVDGSNWTYNGTTWVFTE